jgi:hypothetical protein
LTPHHIPATSPDTTLTAVTHSHITSGVHESGISTGYLLLAALLVAGGYLVACWIWPFAACMRCKGAGKFRSPSGRAWRYCRRCNGRGARLRIGRRIWNFLTDLHDGNR